MNQGEFERRIEEIVAAEQWGRPSAAKRGRHAAWPFVPVIDFGEQTQGVHRARTEQLLAKAFETREEAVAYAARVIAARQDALRDRLWDPRHRALREQHGLPREIGGPTAFPMNHTPRESVAL